MPHIYRTKLWQVTLPDGWRVTGGPELVTIWNPEGVGQLRVLAIDECKAPPKNAQGHDFTGKLQGRTYDFSSGARHWTLMCAGQWIYVKYSCATKNAELERAQIDEILRSVSETV
jgi:hypothetical protein